MPFLKLYVFLENRPKTVDLKCDTQQQGEDLSAICFVSLDPSPCSYTSLSFPSVQKCLVYILLVFEQCVLDYCVWFIKLFKEQLYWFFPHSTSQSSLTQSLMDRNPIWNLHIFPNECALLKFVWPLPSATIISLVKRWKNTVRSLLYVLKNNYREEVEGLLMSSTYWGKKYK